MSVAVFINQITNEGEDGADPVLRSDEEMQKLQTLVANAVGLDEERGDTLTLETLPFMPVSTGGVLVTANPAGEFMQQHLMTAIQIIVLSIVTLVLALFVVKPLLMPKDLPAQLAAANMAAIDGGETPALSSAQTPDAVAALKEVATTRSDEAASLIKSWLETTENAA